MRFTVGINRVVEDMEMVHLPEWHRCLLLGIQLRFSLVFV